MQNYLSRAQKALDDCSPELCLSITETALKLYPQHSGLTVMKGVALLDLLNLSQTEKEAMQYFEASKNAFLKAIDLDVNNVESFLYLGQLTTDRESIDWYSKAFGLLESQFNELTNEQDKIALKKRMAQVLCSCIEVFMTDCCEEKDAESQCNTLIEKAVQLDRSQEVLQTLSNIRLSQCRDEEAKTAALEAFQLWLNEKPDADACVALGKLLVETTEYKHAEQVLAHVVEADDSISDAWLALGIALKMTGQNEDASDCLERAEMMGIEGAMALLNDSEALEKEDHWEMEE